MNDAQNVLKELKNNTNNEVELISAYLIAQTAIYLYNKDIEKLL